MDLSGTSGPPLNQLLQSPRVLHHHQCNGGAMFDRSPVDNICCYLLATTISVEPSVVMPSGGKMRTTSVSGDEAPVKLVGPEERQGSPLEIDTPHPQALLFLLPEGGLPAVSGTATALLSIQICIRL